MGAAIRSVKNGKEKPGRKDNFKLVMVLGGSCFHAKYIPSSLNLSSLDQVPAVLDREDEIVVY